MKAINKLARKQSRPKSDFSKQLRLANSLVQQRKTEKALAFIESKLLEGNLSNLETSKLISLLAVSELKLGRYEKAAEYYRTASEYVTDDKRAWVQPALGEVRALVRAGRVDQGVALGWEVVNKSLDAQNSWMDLQGSIEEQLGNGESVRIEARPVRPSVVCYKAGIIFLEKRHLNFAKEFFTEAIVHNPNGATRAREGLARVALAEGAADVAETRANEAFQVGKYQVKTISVWPILIEARKKQGKPGIDNSHVTGLGQIKSSTAKARAVLVIITSLRSYGDEYWKEIASSYIDVNGGEDTHATLEVKKLLLAEEKILGRHSEISKLSKDILASRYASPADAVSSGKSYINSLFALGGDVLEIGSIIDQVKEIWGDRISQKVAYGMALISVENAADDLAIELLNRLAESSGSRGSTWEKATRKLAEIHYKNGQYQSAMSAYRSLVEHQPLKVVIRAKALSMWIESMKAAGEEVEGGDLGDQFLQLGSETDDWSVLLDVARQAALSRDHCSEASINTIYNDGVSLALEALQTEEHPTKKMAVLLKLARRQLLDFHFPNHVVSVWSEMTEGEREAIKSDGASYWEYITLVLKAYAQLNNYDEFSRISNSILSNPETPKLGLVYVGMQYSLSLISRGQVGNGLNHIREFVKEMPTHKECSRGYYWLMVKSLSEQFYTDAVASGFLIKKCFSGGPSLQWEKDLVERANAVITKYGDYNFPPQDAKAIEKVESDIELLHA